MNKEYDFKQNLKESESPEIQTGIEQILRKEFGSNIRIDWTTKDMKAQLTYSNDLVVIEPDGTKTTIDYKVCGNNWLGNCFIETCSQYRNNKCDSIGWFYASPANYVLYVYRTKANFNQLIESKYFLMPLKNSKLRTYILNQIETKPELTIHQKNGNYVTKGFAFTISELEKIVEDSKVDGFQSNLNLWG